jgi:hypothetical protein
VEPVGGDVDDAVHAAPPSVPERRVSQT